MNDYDLIIFDADGTLTPQRDGSCGEFSYSLLPGVSETCAALHAEGIVLAIASNQSKRRNAGSIRAQLYWTANRLCIDNELVKWSTDNHVKKPNPAMLNTIMEDTQKNRVLFVGDQETDRRAAKRAGVDFAWADEFFERM